MLGVAVIFPLTKIHASEESQRNDSIDFVKFYFDFRMNDYLLIHCQ